MLLCLTEQSSGIPSMNCNTYVYLDVRMYLETYIQSNELPFCPIFGKVGFISHVAGGRISALKTDYRTS